jgi:glycosyltransferase involved in cell wall biosynthesis
MKFSIIIPVYNIEKYLEQCLDSVLNQGFVDYELICINDGSTDGSGEILEKYAEKYPQLVLINQPNQGMSLARNAGIKAAKGEYILFLDSDDSLTSDALFILQKHIQKEDMLCFNAKRFIENEQREDCEEGFSDAGLTGWEYFNKYALRQRKIHFVVVWQRAYKREFLLQNQLLFQPGIMRAEDNLFTYHACYCAHSVAIIPDILYSYRIREASITTTKSAKYEEDSFKVLLMLSEFFISKKDIDKTVLYPLLASGYINLFANSSVAQDRVWGKRINWKYFKTFSITTRHRFLYRLVRISPILLRLYLRQ